MSYKDKSKFNSSINVIETTLYKCFTSEKKGLYSV